MISFIKKPSVYISGIVLALLVAGGFLFASGPKTLQGESVSASLRDIEQEALITGTVKADKKVSLSFDRAGSISSLPYSVGGAAAQGRVVASLRSETERADIAEAEAAVGVAKAKQEGVTAGSRIEEVRVKEGAVLEKEVSLANLLENTGSISTDTYGKAETALHTTIDPLFEGDMTSAPRLAFSSNNQSAAFDSESKRQQAEASLKVLKNIGGVVSGEEEQTLTVALRELRAMQGLFQSLGDTLQTVSGLSEATTKDYKDRTETARANTAASVTAIQSHQNKVRDARVSLEKAKRELALVTAGAAKEDLNEARQNVLQAEAKLRGTQAALEKTLIRAPFAGRIASKHVEVGETVSAGKPVLEFIGTGGFIIEASVPEADITKIEKGDTAKVTLDAYSDAASFTAKVIVIEPAETKVDGVPTYKTTLAFTTNDPKLRSGMTANISIKTVLKQQALVIPSRAVLRENGVSYVHKKLHDGTTEKVSVTTGLRSASGDTEILEGLSLGDQVIIPASK